MKRFNYTGRQKIFKDSIIVGLNSSFTERPVIHTSLNLSNYSFPSEALIFLEVQRKTRFMRLPLGTISQPKNLINEELHDFDNAENLNCKLKVVEGATGRILGFADQIKLVDKNMKPDPNQESILPVKSIDLSRLGTLWNIDFSNDKIILEVEEKLGPKESVVRSAFFKGFILPAAFKEILHKITDENSYQWDEDLEDTENVANLWILFIKQMGLEEPESNDQDNIEEWIENAVAIFCKRLGVRNKVIEEFQKGSWQ